MYDIIIIGGGVSGIAAAIYSARFNLKTLILSQETGGLIQYTHLVENYPGYKSISGPQLADKFKEHVDDYKDLVDIKEEPAVDIEKKNSVFKVKTQKSSYEGKTILIATGTRRKELNAKGRTIHDNVGTDFLTFACIDRCRHSASAHHPRGFIHMGGKIRVVVYKRKHNLYGSVNCSLIFVVICEHIFNLLFQKVVIQYRK